MPRRAMVSLSPLAVIVVVVVAAVGFGPKRVVLGLVAIAPLLAANILNRRITALYAVLALITAISECL